MIMFSTWPSGWASYPGRFRVMLAPSCSLPHVPLDLDAESLLDPEIRPWLAFAVQKCRELKTLAALATTGKGGDALEQDRIAGRARRASTRSVNLAVRQRAQAMTPDMQTRRSPYVKRRMCQGKVLDVPLLPTTTIGSVPQTRAVREARRRHRTGQVSTHEYEQVMRDVIEEIVHSQEQLGLDVLVHGEPERNDMVEYFAERLEGFWVTQHGWVQSYGSRCAKPPILFGDVSRPRPITVEWARFAQSLTTKPLKGILTGPVTILQWSYARDDLPRKEVCRQLALAIRDEVADLEVAGIKIIQVDEPALREGLPLRRDEQEAYLRWATEAFRLATSVVKDGTQIHTHMCYGDFNNIAEWIAALDADVISLEASRSRMEIIPALRELGHPNEIGLGVWDIHSPRVPPAEEMSNLLRQALEVVPAERLWVNPDCGLKTRSWCETIASLEGLVWAANTVRRELQGLASPPAQ